MKTLLLLFCRLLIANLRLFLYSSLVTCLPIGMVLHSSLTMAQGWERTYGGINYDQGNFVQQTFDDGFIIVGRTSLSNAVYIIKTDVNGDTLWTKIYNSPSFDIGSSVDITYDNGYIITGLTGSDVLLLKMDASGNFLWTKNIGSGGSPKGNSVKQTNDSGYVIVGSKSNNVYLIKTNSGGDTLWTKTYGGVNDDYGNSVQQTTDGGFIITGGTASFANSVEVYLIKTDNNGDTLWTRTFGDINNDEGAAVQQTDDGGYVIIGTKNFGGSLAEVYLLKINNNGGTLWTKTYGGNLGDRGLFIQQTNDGGYIITGQTESFGFGSMDVYLIKTDSNGNTIWTKTFGGINNEVGNCVQQISGGGYIIVGETYSFGVGSDVYLIKTDSLGNSITNIISGNIFHDVNSNCIKDSTEFNLKNAIIKLLPNTKYATTNSTGKYSFLVDTGTYTVQSISPNNYWQQTCPNPPTYTVNFTSFYDTSSANDFGYEIAVFCPLMTVDISTWALRPCSISVYTVHYCNTGTIPADSAFIEVEFDNDITPVSSTLNWSSQSGNTYTFNIGNVAPNECGNFYITADVSCIATVGSTHCIEAHIFPDSICTPVDSSWDKSSVSVEGICVNDSLACFTIYNSGDAMQGASSWRIYENNVLVDTGIFQLAAGDSIVICHSAEGLTIRLEADQRPAHPGNSEPNANVEMCGGVPPAAMGFITQVPEDDADEFIEMDCREITGSYDPNEKLVKPAGISQNHFIDSTDVLEYQINFQNTGTDTAFKIVVRDTLTHNLDITTVQSGASSHPYSFRIYGTGILEWTFSNILLPDSNTNENASHGFVRFKAKQKTGNTIGTLIENRASIYFDYNAPVITNTAFNTVWKEAPLSLPRIYEENMGIMIYPNPFTETTTIVIASGAKQSHLKIYNLLGEEISNYQLTTNNYQLKRGNLPAGIYIYKVFSSEKLIGAGKLVAE